ncbi:hypothetical protein CLOSTHATH_06254 [Hungatella hathewayi DSM 13479]|uniref:Uncharacterized protein n=1 Tax=Hungatella hathewayi DSM 13479 TaxID=566550 RepID=D3ARJ8_9FIRM|nr:hypothetical protein CLOSTHATH_06254 [Hungatella hathewayi DSM 13479]
MVLLYYEITVFSMIYSIYLLFFLFDLYSYIKFFFLFIIAQRILQKSKNTGLQRGIRPYIRKSVFSY